MRDIKDNPGYEAAQAEYDDEYTWEYNLEEKVRWGTDDAPSDMCFYVRVWLEKIAEEEGYELVKKEK